MKFLSPLVTQKYRAGEFVIYHDFLFEFTVRGKRYRGAVPRGYITDFASIPKISQLLPWFGVNDDSAFSAVFHDFNYSSQGRLRARCLASGQLVDLELSRKDCDLLLVDGLLAKGYPRSVANIFYAAVRVGGLLYWNRRRYGINGGYDFVPESYWLSENGTKP